MTVSRSCAGCAKAATPHVIVWFHVRGCCNPSSHTHPRADEARLAFPLVLTRSQPCRRVREGPSSHTLVLAFVLAFMLTPVRARVAAMLSSWPIVLAVHPHYYPNTP